MKWYRRWESRRRESSYGKLKMRADWGLFGFWMVIIFIILALSGVLVWAATRCRAWQTIEQDIVSDKQTRNYTTTYECGESTCFTHHTDYVLYFKGGDIWSTDRATYDRVHVGDNVTYPKNHFACDK